MIAKLALAFLLATSAASNPFEPAKNANENAAKAKYVNRLLGGAKPTARSQLGRKLNDDEYMPDISGYSVRFEQCQFVKAYDDEMADNEEAGTVLATKRFVIFRLCPTDSDSCNYNYGEYLVSMEEYLEAYVEFVLEEQEEWCGVCEEACDNGDRRNLDDNASANADYDCSCMDTCHKIENMEENGYIDATEFLECQLVQVNDDDKNAGTFAGPYCSGGEKIKIGVFSDEECMFLESGKDVADYLIDDDGVQMKLSFNFLKKTYDASNPVSCLDVEEDNEDENDDNNNDDEDGPEVTEMCEQLYEAAAKCEKTHGFDDGYANYHGYTNQLAQESVVCNFISTLKSGTYGEEGAIHLSGGTPVRNSGDSGITGGQKFALTFFISGTVGLVVYAAMLHSQLVKGPKADSRKQGGASQELICLNKNSCHLTS